MGQQDSATTLRRQVHTKLRRILVQDDLAIFRQILQSLEFGTPHSMKICYTIMFSSPLGPRCKISMHSTNQTATTSRPEGDSLCYHPVSTLPLQFLQVFQSILCEIAFGMSLSINNFGGLRTICAKSRAWHPMFRQVLEAICFLLEPRV